MAAEDRRTTSDLKLELLKRGESFSFYQLVRLLRFLTRRPGGTDGGDLDLIETVRIKPKLSLAFPASDVEKAEEHSGPAPDDAPYMEVTVTFMGLYGESSPLPAFYTEDLIEQVGDDDAVAKDFIDVMHHRLYLLLFRSWCKYRQFIQVVEEQNPSHLERLYSLMGFGEPVWRETVPDPYSLIRYIGLLTQQPRGALGLKTLLRDALGAAPVEIVSNVQRKAKIPEEQRFVMGGGIGNLGKDTFVGEEIEERMGKFRIRVGPLTAEEFQGFLPGTEKYTRLVGLTRLFVLEALVFDVELRLASGQARKPSLGGGPWARLGMDTWSFSGAELGEVSVFFHP